MEDEEESEDKQEEYDSDGLGNVDEDEMSE